VSRGRALAETRTGPEFIRAPIFNSLILINKFNEQLTGRPQQWGRLFHSWHSQSGGPAARHNEKLAGLVVENPAGMFLKGLSACCK
jgi:hypothetical protein